MRIELPNPVEFAKILTEVTGVNLFSPVSGVATDSRECQPGDLFIALAGERVNGHRFLAETTARGCTSALVSKVNQEFSQIQQIAVDDPLLTIGLISHSWRKQFDIPVIGITGTNGKTSTKELIRHILEFKYNVHATAGNFNTAIGLPLTLLQMTEKHSISLIEMGANQPGDISYLCTIAEPNLGLITNIAAAHLEGFGTVEKIMKEKGSLFKSLSKGTAFVNMTDERIKSLPLFGNAITYGQTLQCDFSAQISYHENGTFNLTFDTKEIATNSHNATFVKNVIAAAAVTVTLGVDWNTFQDRILSYQSPAGRCEIKYMNNLTVIDDTYNANLESTSAAIDYLIALNGRGRRILVFGDMFELGDNSPDLHRKVGQKCSTALLDIVYTVGKETIYTDQELDNLPIHKHFETKSDLTKELKNILHSGDKVLFKGSRGMAMETVIEDMFQN